MAAVAAPDGPVTVGVRPEHLQLHSAYADGMVPARVDFCEPLGSHVLVTALVDVPGRFPARHSGADAGDRPGTGGQ